MSVPRKTPAWLGAHPAAKIALRLVVWAVLLALTFALVHVLGFRAYTSILSGTGSFDDREAMFGLVYLACYGVFVVLVPVLLLAAGLLEGVAWAGGLHARTSQAATHPERPEHSATTGRPETEK